jgi:GTPase SAR1 family protein
METYVVAMLGESGVGKSALLMQLVMESFVGTLCPPARCDVPLTIGLAPSVYIRRSTSAAAAYVVSDCGQGYDNIRGQTARKQLTVDDQLCVLDFVELSTEGAPSWHPLRPFPTIDTSAVGRSGLSTRVHSMKCAPQDEAR